MSKLSDVARELQNEEDNGVNDEEEIIETPKKVTVMKAKSVMQRIKENTDHTRKVLENEPQVDFMVQLPEGEPEGSYDDVSINGVEFKVYKGVVSHIPKSVAEILANKYRIAAAVTTQYKRAEGVPELN